MKFKGNFIKALTADDGTIELSLSTRDRGAVNALKSLCGQELTVECKKWRNQRSLNANAYFHTLVGAIAIALKRGEEEIKMKLVLDYGAVARDEKGDMVGIMLPASVNVNTVYKYAKWFDKREINGKLFNCYIVYTQTHLLNTAEMARLIDGAVQDAQQVGIDTRTPKEIEAMKQAWKAQKE